MAHLIVVEDDDVIGATLESALRANGHRVDRFTKGRDALDWARTGSAALALVDVGLPDIDGLAVCRELREILPTVVIVMLTARGSQIDIVAGLESGADDYITKPFAVVELLARIRAHLRRSEGRESESLDAGPITCGSLVVDVAGRTVLVGESEVRLRPREFDLLHRLARDPGVAVRREDLIADVWDSNWFGSTKTLDVHMGSLRRALRAAAVETGGDALRDLPVIVTLRGHGYRLQPRPPRA